MKKPVLAIMAVAFVAGIMGCEELEEGPLEAELQTEAVCPGGVGAFDVYVERKLSPIGAAGNDLAFTDGAVWIVESVANTVSRFDLARGQMEHGFIDVGNERNPYALAVDEDSGEVWIANYASGTVTVADMKTGAVIVELEDDAFNEPSAVALSDEFAYVANVDFRGLAAGYGPGNVAVIDRSNHQVVSELEMAFPNPHFLEIEEVDGQPALFVSGTGAIRMTENQVRVESEGGLQWFDLSVDPVFPTMQISRPIDTSCFASVIPAPGCRRT